MLDEARKREKVANAVLGLAFATSASQSPRDFVRTGHVEAPGTALMQRTIGNPRRQRKDLDNPRVVSRGTKLKEAKTFKQFLEEASIITEMRKEDKVKGKEKTPLKISRTRSYTTLGSAKRAPEGSGKKWIVTPSKTETHTDKVTHPDVSMGRFKQGGSGGGREYGYKRHAHGGAASWQDRPGAGSQRGVKKVKGEKKPEIGHITPAQKIASRRKRAEYFLNRECYELEESSTGERSGTRTRGKVTLARGRGADMTSKERSTAAIAKKAGIKGTGKYSTKDLRTRGKEYRTDDDRSPYGEPKSTKQDTTITTHSSPRSAAAGERIIAKTKYIGNFKTKHVSSADSVRKAKDFKKSLIKSGANKRGRVHSVDIIQRGNYDKNDPEKQIERGKNLIKAVKDAPKHLKKLGAKKGEAVIGEPSATMPDENKNVGSKKREKIYKNIFKNRISKASPKTGRMVGKMD